MRTFALTAALLGAALALPSTGCTQESGQDKAFGDKVRAYLLAHPEVIEEAVDRLQANTQARKDAVAKTAIADHRQSLERDSRDFVAGNPARAVTLVELFDYSCPFCKAAQPDALLAEKHLDEADIQRLLKATGVDLAKAKAQAGAPEVTALLGDNHKLAREIGIDGTPAFIIGDRMIAGADMAELETAIQGAREANKRASR